MTGLLRVLEVDRLDLGQRKVALVVARRADDAIDRVAGAQRMLPDHVGADVDVVRSRQIVRLGRPQEAEAVLDDLQHAAATDFPALFRMLLQDRKHHLALAHGRGVLDLPFLGHRQQVGGAFCLEVGQIQAFFGHSDANFRPRDVSDGADRCSRESRTGRPGLGAQIRPRRS